MAIIKKIFEIKECNWSCPLLSRCTYDDEDCNFYDKDTPCYAMKPKDKKPKYCKVTRVIVEVEMSIDDPKFKKIAEDARKKFMKL